MESALIDNLQEKFMSNLNIKLENILVNPEGEEEEQETEEVVK